MSVTRRFGTMIAIGWVLGMVPEVWARPPEGPRTIRTPDQALRHLGDPGEPGGWAEELLASWKGLLPRWEAGLSSIVDAKPEDEEVASRIVRILEAQGETGCAFLGRRLGVRRPALVSAALARGADRFPCEEFGNGLLRLVAEGRKVAREPGWEEVFREVWTEVRRRGAPLEVGPGCPWILETTGELRELALDALLAKAPEGLAECLVRAWEELARRGRDPEFRARLLRGLAERERNEAIPALTRALQEETDRALACRLLLQQGRSGLEGLVFALRTGDGRDEGIQRCLLDWGPQATADLLPLVDHPAPKVRDFVLRFLVTHRTPEGRQALATRFLERRGPVPRALLLRTLAAFGAEAIGEPLRAALSDEDPALRRAGLLVVEETDARAVLDLVREIAEEDPEASLRILALEVGWHLGDEATLEIARRQPSYEEPSVAAKALQVLAFLGGEGEVSAVVSALSHPNPEIAQAAERAAWSMGLQAPRKRKVRYVAPPGMPKPPRSREIACEGVSARVLGKKGPVAIVLPGGPAMDLSWAEPWIWDLADDGRVALVSVQGDGEEARAGLASPEQVRCLADLLGADRVMLVSAGIGGTWAKWIAGRMPDRVGAVVAIASPLPGRFEDLDRALVESLEEPLRAWAEEIVRTQQRFRAEVLHRAFARIFARPLAGPKGDPQQALRVQWDVRRTGAAVGLVSRWVSEAGTGDSDPSVLWVLPGVDLPSEVRDAYLARATDPKRDSVVSWEGCGFLPGIACGPKVVKVLAERLQAMAREGGR